MKHIDITFSPKAQTDRANLHITSPFTGKVRPLCEHPEPFFKFGTLGPGIIVELTSHKVLAPFDGMLIQVKNAGTEFVLQAKNGLKILINLYIDQQIDMLHTHIAQLNGSKIVRGQRLAYFDLRNLNTPLLATLVLLNGHQLTPIHYSLSHVSAGIDTLLTLTKKK